MFSQHIKLDIYSAINNSIRLSSIHITSAND